MKKITLTFLLITFLSLTLFSQTFTEMTSISLTGVSNSSVAWGDYDNDGDLDILLTGKSSNDTITKIYRNDGANVFTDIDAGLIGVFNGDIDWGDYDNDGDLDILIAGYTGYEAVTRIYRNDGSDTFTDINADLIGVNRCSVAWGDYDNDGDLDMVITGENVNGSHSKIYRNDGSDTFTDINADLIAVNYSSVAWGDYDNDGDLDLLLSGNPSSLGTVTKIYENINNEIFSETQNVLTGVYMSNNVWGDIDNDGDLDILITDSPGKPILYENKSNGEFIEHTSIINSIVDMGMGTFGDFDNDGDLDILFTGFEIASVYQNNGEMNFSEAESIYEAGIDYSSSAWGDYDNDGDLDIIATGSGYTKIFKNNSTVTNSSPSIPINLTSSIISPKILFTWSKSNDSETLSSGLTYNLFIRSVTDTIIYPNSNPGSSYLIKPQMGNVQLDTMHYLRKLSPGKYFWQVQAVDNSYTGSAFSLESSIDVPNIPQIKLVNDKLYFGKNSIGNTLSLNVELVSSGNDTLFIDSISGLSNPYTKIYASPDTVLVDDTAKIQVDFTPSTIGQFNDTLIIYSNASVDSILRVPIEGFVPTNVCDNGVVIAENTTWRKANSPYFVECNLAVDQGVTLTIEPGVTVYIDTMKQIIVDGELIANGTEGDTIVFKTSGDYKFDQIYSRSSAKGNFSYFKIEKAQTGIYIENDTINFSNGLIQNCDIGIEIVNSNFKIEYTNFLNNDTAIISNGNYDCLGEINYCQFERNKSAILTGDGEYYITGNKIKDNQTYAIYFNGDGYKFISENIIINNLYGIFTDGSTFSTDIENNNISNNYDYGIFGKSQMTIRSNKINNNKAHGIICSMTSVLIEKNSIYENSLDGINDNSNSTIKNNDIFKNGDDGIETSGIPIINQNNIYNNTNYNVHATKQSSETINAENNYWGVTTTTEIRNTIYDYYDDGVTVKVDFEPFYTEQIHRGFAKSDTICYGENDGMLIAEGEDIKWYDDRELTNLIYSGDTLLPTETEVGIYTYFVTRNYGGNTESDSALFIISSVPDIVNIDKTNESDCNTNDATITITATDENPLVYSINNGNEYLDNNGLFTSLGNGNYKVIVKNSYVCSDTTDLIEILSDGEIPPAPGVSDNVSYCYGATIEDLTATPSSGGLITWYSDYELVNIVGTGTNFSPGNLEETTTFYVTETVGNCESPSSSVTVTVINEEPYQDEEICLVTVDPETLKNKIIWEKTDSVGISEYNIYRENINIGEYDLIGTVPFNDYSVFTDNESQPGQRSYQYKLSAVDSCGNESDLSFYHRTMLLKISVGIDAFNLDWDTYEYEGGGFTFSKYYIYRGDSSSLEIIDSIGGNYNSYVDVDPPDGELYYQIGGVKPGGCIPTGNKKSSKAAESISYSNLENNGVTGILFEDKDFHIGISPNPSEGKFELEISNLSYDIRIEIFSITGRLVYAKKYIKTDNDRKELIDLSNEAKGIYIVKFSIENRTESTKLLIQ